MKALPIKRSKSENYSNNTKIFSAQRRREEKRKTFKWDYEPLDGNGISILELTNDTCRWPCNDGVFCGATVHKQDYCETHFNVMRGKE